MKTLTKILPKYYNKFNKLLKIILKKCYKNIGGAKGGNMSD